MKKDNSNYYKCDHLGCEKQGEYKAPKDRTLTSNYWFCLEHVREYNKNWNYYTGYTPDEIEQSIRDDVIWQRDTKRFGSLGNMKQRFHLPQKVTQALAVFDLHFPYTHKELKARYKVLAKRYHPDTNQGNKLLEEKFKNLTENYKILLEFIY